MEADANLDFKYIIQSGEPDNRIPWGSRERHPNFPLIIFVFRICAVCFVFNSLINNEHVIFKLTK